MVPAGWRINHPQRWQEQMLIEFRMRRKRALRSVLLSGYKAALQRDRSPDETEPKSEGCSDTESCEAAVPYAQS
jgi:hypothetical protein